MRILFFQPEDGTTRQEERPEKALLTDDEKDLIASGDGVLEAFRVVGGNFEIARVERSEEHDDEADPEGEDEDAVKVIFKVEWERC